MIGMLESIICFLFLALTGVYFLSSFNMVGQYRLYLYEGNRLMVVIKH